eukprot:scaffold19723_cov97-Phaeocystis_antarctica.AAC.5
MNLKMATFPQADFPPEALAYRKNESIGMRSLTLSPSPHAQITPYPVSANGTLIILDDGSSAEEVDLFNNMQNIVITNADKDVWQQIGKVNLNAHSPNPGAPEHLAMVNNLFGDNAEKKHTDWHREALQRGLRPIGAASRPPSNKA